MDDILATGVHIKQVIKQLYVTFSLKNLGLLHYFLGIEATHVKGSLVLCQRKYIKKLLARFELDQVRPVETLMPVTPKLSKLETEHNSSWKLQYDISAYTDLKVNSAADFVKELYGLGARRIGVFSTPPIGCVPSQRTLGGGFQRGCAEDYNVAATPFNKKLLSVLNSVRASMPDGRFVYIDVYNPLFDLIQNPHKSGIFIKYLLLNPTLKKLMIYSG
ncbi:GDSL esterase/lipase At2g24560-like [Hibiscus syriacus]|uniref:GDSL esterase/lipase At2g24560-like n=1 Tax=Hibiscus syriacus TaxID=106335 RepID=UPI001920D348|nr:GDSL esterase/lipase At2g24560-like [Hibiscus syriacus]